MMMEMVLILLMMVMERPPPTPRRRGGEDGGDFPLLRGSRAAGSGPSRRRQRLHRCRILDESQENRVTPVLARRRRGSKGKSKRGPRSERVGPTRTDSLTVWAMPIGPHDSSLLVLAAWAMPIRPLWLLSSGSFSHDLSPRKIMTMHFSPSSFGIQKVLKHQKHGKREFSGSQKLHATNRDFVRKSHKLCKICTQKNITMQKTFQYDNMN
jgi:hypothetical protein